MYDRKSKPCETGIVKQGKRRKKQPANPARPVRQKRKKEMKKLMFGMAVAAGLMACADIESANVVGYATTDLNEGSTMCAPAFILTGSETKIDISSLLPVGDEIDPDGAVNLQTLDAFGRTVDTFFWINWGGEDIGWMDEGYQKVSTQFERGTGLWTSSPNGTTQIQTLGEVSFKDCKIQLRDGSLATGNMTPLEVDIQDILVEGDDIDGDGAINIQTLDAYGRTIDTFFWINWGGDDIGWMDEGYSKVEKKFAPGQGLWVSAVNETTYIRFPAPEVK